VALGIDVAEHTDLALKGAVRERLAWQKPQDGPKTNTDD
jgi:hypothetical protein